MASGGKGVIRAGIGHKGLSSALDSGRGDAADFGQLGGGQGGPGRAMELRAQLGRMHPR